MFDSTMLDDVTLTCSVDPFGQALTAKNVIVDESKKTTLPFEAHRTVSVFRITSSPVPGYFLRICSDDDDDDDVTIEFAASCPLLVL